MLSWLTGGAQKLPVTVGDKVSTDYAVSSWWQLHEGKKKVFHVFVISNLQLGFTTPGCFLCCFFSLFEFIYAIFNFM